jgi:hypothetical protein
MGLDPGIDNAGQFVEVFSAQGAMRVDNQNAIVAELARQ